MKHSAEIVIGIMIAAIAMMIMPVSAVLAQPTSNNETQATNAGSPNTSTPILGGVANLQVTRNGDNQLTVEITKSTANNETTVISSNGTVTEVPGGNVTIVDNGTVVVAPNGTDVSTTPSNVTVIVPPNATNPAQPCTCNQTNQTQKPSEGIPPVIITPAPGQNVTTKPPEITPLPPIENTTNPNPPVINNTNPVPPFPSNNQTTNNGTGNGTGNNTTNPVSSIIPGFRPQAITYHPMNSWALHA